MERRGRIPVAKFRTQEGKSRSRSRVREPDYNEQDPETDLFTLLEDNIALKEENKALKQELENTKKEQLEFEAEKALQDKQLETLKQRQINSEQQLKELSEKCTKLSSERSALDKLHKMKVDIINSMSNELQLLQEKRDAISPAPAAVMITSQNLKSKLLKILPAIHGCNELESLVDVESPVSMALGTELVERLADEFLALKSQLGAVELQLYEANEKVSELIEQQQQLEQESETLRSENVNLTKVAKLLTENMKESVQTSKKMEAALIKLKKRNEELMVAKTRDTTDAPPITDAPAEEPLSSDTAKELKEIQQEVESQNQDHGERIVEMGLRRVSGFFRPLSGLFRSS